MRILFAEHSAWRGVYVYRGERSDGRERLLFRFVFDPSRSYGPGFSIGVGQHSWRPRCPSISWPVAARFRFLLPLYRWQSRILCKLDGRGYGRELSWLPWRERAK